MVSAIIKNFLLTDYIVCDKMSFEVLMNNKYNPLLLKNQICFPTYAAANRFINNYRPFLKKLDLTYTQYIVMMILWEKEKVNEKDLVNSLYLKSNTLAPLLKKLKDKSYIEIKKDKDDKRNIDICITQKGKKLKEKALNIPKIFSKNFPLTEEEVDTYRHLINKLINWKI